MPTLTHQRIIEREMKKYQRKGFLAIPQAKVGNYLFDLLVIKFPSKEVEILEVDIATKTLKEKIDFAKTFATIKIFRPTPTKIEINREVEAIGNALGDVVRLKMMRILSDGPVKHNELINGIGLHPVGDAGRFGYHLKQLVKARLVEAHEGKYVLTERGKKVLEVLLEST